MNKVFDVFISYRRSDGSDLAQQLFFYLSRKGIRAFLDKEKLMNGTYFDTQLREKLISAPHYVLIGTTDAFCDREGEDWVKEEIELAIEEYDRSEAIEPGERTITVIHPHDAVFPDSLHSDKLDKILKVQRIEIPYGHDSTDAFAAVFDVVTKVSKRNLWHSAQRWYESSKKSGGRFARLHIEESIIPKAGDFMRRGEMPVNVNIDEKNGDEAPLLDAINATGEHLFLIGQGGIGKTTSLMKIMDDAYADRPFSDERQVPIFVELSYAPDNDGRYYEQGKSSFIRRSIFKQIRDRDLDNQSVMNAVDKQNNPFSISSETAVLPINRLFTKKTKRPEYLLLLDGLNEVSTAKVKNNDNTVIDLIRGEIRYLINECPNVRVILTSRSDDTCGYFNELKRLYLSGVDENSIRNYLADCEMSEAQIEAAIADEHLKDALKIPLFLTMYATLKNKDDVCTQGEILYCFFHERRENIGVYTVQDRIARVGENAASSAPVMEEARLTVGMQNFIIDIVLPEIGRYMEKNVKFHISRKVLREIISTVLDGREDTDFCGICGDDAFKISNRQGTRREPSMIADEIKEKFANNKNRITASMIECLVYSLGIMQINTDESGYGFIHQHVRDFFAAVSYINAMRLAFYIYNDGEKTDALSVMNERFKDKPIGMQVRRFIGEALGEHHNTPYYDNGWKQNTPENDPLRGLITRTLNIYRGMDRDEGGYGVYSLVHILNEIRGELSGIDFSGIDFTRCSLNGMRLSRKGVEAMFDKAVLSYKELGFFGHTGAISSAAFSPDGSRIVTASDDGTAKIWDAESFELLGTTSVAHSGVKAAVFSPDGSRVLTILHTSFSAKVFDSYNLQIVGVLKSPSHLISSAAFSHDGKRIITTCHKKVEIWDAESFALTGTIEKKEDYFSSAAFSPDGNIIITCSSRCVEVWDAHSLELLGSLTDSDWVRSAAFSLDGKMIITASDDKTAILWDTTSLTMIGKFEGHKNAISSASFSPNGRRVITSSDDCTVKIWDTENCVPIETMYYDYRVKSASFSFDGKRIITLCNGTVIVRNAENFALLGTIDRHSPSVKSAVFSPYSSRILAASADSVALIWDAINYTLIETLRNHYRTVSSAVFSKDGEMIVITSLGVAEVWSAESFILLKTLIGHSSDLVKSASFSTDNKRIVTAAYDGTAKIWDTNGFKHIGTLESPIKPKYGPDGKRIITISGDIINSATFSPDNLRIITASADGVVRIYDSNSFNLISTLEAHSSYWATSACFSSDGKKIATASQDETAKIWNADSLVLLGTLTDSAWVRSAAFSLAGKMIITASDDKTAKIWDANSFELLATLGGHSGSVNSASFSPDDRLIVTASSDGTVKIWDAFTFKCIKTIPYIPGLILVGIDLTKLDPHSQFSNDEKELLHIYGAKV